MELKKKLNAAGIFSIGAGAMISSGLFVLPALAYREAGPGILFSYAIAGLLMLPAIFTKIELSTAIPKAGGTYFYVDRILGTAAGTIAGFSDWFSIGLKSAFALMGIGAFATLFFPTISLWEIKMIAVAACLLFTVLNLFSVKASGRVQILMVIFLIAILVIYILLGYRHVDFSRFASLLPLGWDKIVYTTGMVFISYGGITKITSIAEEVKNPKKTLVVGIMSAFLIVQAIYLLTIFVLIGVFPGSDLNNSLKPLTDSSFLFLGSFGVIATSIAAILAFATTANAGLMTASRIPLAMSRDDILPAFLQRVSKKYHTPVITVLLTSLFMILIIVALDLADLAKVASLFMIFIFVLDNFAIIVMRYAKIASYKPSFKAPFFPVMQILAIVCYVILIVTMGLLVIAISVSMVLLSLIWYWVFIRGRVRRTSALVHMISGVTSKELFTEPTKLEEELLSILQQREDIVEDRFDKLIRQATILDLSRAMSREEAFTLLAGEVEKKLSIPAETVKRKLLEREAQSSTLLYPGIAIPHAVPHIVIGGEHLFDIFIIRNMKGIVWNEQQEIVRTVFCLIGTKDERNLHLKALAAIAQIIQNFHSTMEWHRARNEKELRNVLLLSKRKRF